MPTQLMKPQETLRLVMPFFNVLRLVFCYIGKETPVLRIVSWILDSTPWNLDSG